MLSVLTLTLSERVGAEELRASGEASVVAETNVTLGAAITNPPVWQLTTPSPRLPPPARPELSIWRSLGSLLMVLGGLFAVTWYLKKRVGLAAGSTGGKRMEVIQRISLGNHQYAALLRVDGQDIILGISPTQITHLGLTSSGTVTPAEVPANFSDILSAVTGKLSNNRKTSPDKP